LKSSARSAIFATMPAMKGWLSWLLVAVSLVAAGVELIIVGIASATGKAWGPPAALFVTGSVGVWWRGRHLLIALAVALLSSAALAVAGWGFPLSAADTERAFAHDHSNLPRPIHCRRDRTAQDQVGTPFSKVYLCSWTGPDAAGQMDVRVNDARIAEEWP
jgi:hypothetical protein